VRSSPKTWTAAVVIVLGCVIYNAAGCGTSHKPAEETTATTETSNSTESAKLASYLKLNFGGGLGPSTKTSWYDLIEKAKASGRYGDVRTSIYNDEEGRTIASYICAAALGSDLVDSARVTDDYGATLHRCP
jgi:hypothetical protein